MNRDIRSSMLYLEAEAIYQVLRRPSAGIITDAVETHVSPDGRLIAFSGSIVDRLEGAPPTRICLADIETGDTRVLTFGPNVDRAPQFSPDGRTIAFLSDRQAAGDFQLHLFDLESAAVRACPRVDGWVEYLQW